MNQFKLWVFVSLTALVAISIAPRILASPAQEGDELYRFTNKKGAVLFNHSQHKDKWTCKSCHPDIPEKYDDGISIMKQAHGLCKKCHTDENGPTKCEGCHQK